jgi:uncharacterized membrane protein
MDARTLHAIIPIAIVAGLALAGYAAYESNVPSAQGSCTVNSFVSCQKVDQSGLTKTFGIQDYLIGIGGYLILLLIDIPLLRTYRVSWLYLLLFFATMGVGFSAYFAYVELVQIGALCLVCFASYTPNFIVWVVGLALLRQSRRRATGDEKDDADP